jgi:glucose-6-phosphate isomerase
VQSLFPGVLENAYRREFQNLVTQNAVPRLWAKDASLWPSEQHQAALVKGNLAWLDLPDLVGPLMARVASRVADIDAAGFEDVVFITMGGASFAAETALQLPSAKIGKRAFLLDSVDPDSIRALEDGVHLDRTLFIFASKSGTGIETHAILLYFLDKLKASGIPSPGRHFVALTEESSYLAGIAGDYGFSDVFYDPPGILGRYSSLIHFNFFLLGVCHLDPKLLLDSTQAMRNVCRLSAPGEENPALSLAAFLAAGEVENSKRLLFLAPHSLQPFVYRMGQLLGASTGKQGRGIIPIFGDSSYGTELLRKGFMAATLQMAGKEDQELEEKSTALREAGVPTVSIQLNGPEDFAVELFKWEVATALACALLQVNPFYDPDVRESRVNAAQILDQISTKQQASPPTVRVSEEELELYAEGETRQQISTLSLTEALRTFFDLRDQKGYLAILPFACLTTAQSAILRQLCDRLVSVLGIPVLVTSGPRYLHGLGQMYKGGPARGQFLFLTTEPGNDVAVPGAGYSFQQLQAALAQGDFAALGRRRRPVIRLHMTRGTESGLGHLATVLQGALGKIRPVSS